MTDSKLKNLLHPRNCLLAVVAFFLLLIILHSCDREPPPGLYPPTGGQGVRIHLVDHGWHAGLVIPSAAARAALPGLPESLLQGGHLEIGWGDEGFYKAGSFEDIDPSLAMRALLWPTASVLHLVAVPEHPAGYFRAESLVEFELSPAGLERMLAYIRQTFRLDAEGRALDAGPGIYGNSRFYQAAPSYHLLRTCNHWTAQALFEAGLPLTPATAFRAGDLVDQLRDLLSNQPAPRQGS